MSQDSIDLGDGFGPIDVIRGAGLGGQAWQWAPKSGEAAPTAGGGTTGTAGGPGTSAVTGMIAGVPSNFLEQIAAAVQ